jgi:hypothetical protein
MKLIRRPARGQDDPGASQQKVRVLITSTEHQSVSPIERISQKSTDLEQIPSSHEVMAARKNAVASARTVVTGFSLDPDLSIQERKRFVKTLSGMSKSQAATQGRSPSRTSPRISETCLKDWMLEFLKGRELTTHD